MPRLLFAVLTLLTVVGLAACSNPQPADPPPTPDNPTDGMDLTVPDVGEPFTMEVGETAAFGDGVSTLTFTEVALDSRCPVDVTCVQAGEAIARFRFFYGDGEDAFELELPGGRPGAVPLDEAPRASASGLVFALLELAPYPGTPEYGEMEPTATLVLERLMR